ncbi:(4Fe-4S)-binding protein [uncultured Marivirga sp.]|uniref:(4Fe-4S)-binding protein n=1 Tax=uncultured Marivirga sp. TaxID=1123707 RepID=UPI0030EEA554|tara:strand:- start:41512 stop:41943 length:432 start_codon:yes stop_codon:yes gene_type:complete
MKVKPTIKAYETDDLVVEWQPSLCIHSEKCWRGLPKVFRPNDKPWVYLEGATDVNIKEQVDTCPSGALSGYWKNKKDESQASPNSAQVEVSKNGPLMVRGKIEIKHADGKSEAKEKVTAFCRCGASSNKPFCDGSHSKIGFEG